MTASISLVGLSSSDPVPGMYAEINFAQGQASNGSGTYAIMLIGGKTSTGSATAGTVIYGPDAPISLSSEADAIALFGAGSELHRMYRRVLAVNVTTPIYAIVVAEGSTPTAATGTITFTTQATGAGSVRIWCGDEFVDSGFSSGDNVTTIATAAKAAVNSRTWWPVTADNSAGVLTLTAKQGGLRGNFIRYFAQIKPSTSGTTVTPVASTLATGGLVTDSSTTALGTLLPKRYYYLVSAAEDATQLGALLSQVNTQALAITGIRQRIFAGSVDTISNALTIATGLNGARADIQWLAQGDLPPCELAANLAAVVALEEAPLVPRCNFSGYGNDEPTSKNWKVKAPLSGAAPTRAQILSALNGGLSPIGVNPTGSTYLVALITTRSLSGATADYRIRAHHKVTIPDRFTDDLLAKETAALSGKNLANDPVKNEPQPGPKVVTPRVIAALVRRLIDDYAENGLLQNAADIKASLICQRETSPTDRCSTQIELQPVDILNQVANKIDQVA